MDGCIDVFLDKLFIRRIVFEWFIFRTMDTRVWCPRDPYRKYAGICGQIAGSAIDTMTCSAESEMGKRTLCCEGNDPMFFFLLVWRLCEGVKHIGPLLTKFSFLRRFAILKEKHWLWPLHVISQRNDWVRLFILETIIIRHDDLVTST